MTEALLKIGAILAVFLIIGGGGMYVRDLQHDLQETRQALDDAHDAIDALAAERAAADARAQRLANAREEILTAPADEDGPVSPVLERALRAADKIGGINP
ncbi:hypothetical protein [Pelagibacterium sp.]|uniref:hypothetical protein n=1 Tax=Pelagibacterium sp. TaxID=1967288 RepID=UPI003A94440B